jgi:hypothetical protein
VLAPLGGVWRAGVVRGRLIERAIYGGRYPGLTLDAHGEAVGVMVLEADGLRGRWGELDAFEGPAYRRVATDVELEDGTRERAMVYVPAPNRV